MNSLIIASLFHSEKYFDIDVNLKGVQEREIDSVWPQV
jgi:hypothetical protein